MCTFLPLDTGPVLSRDFITQSPVTLRDKLLFNGDNQMEKKHYYGDIKNLTERKENTYGKRNEHPGTVTSKLCTS